MAQTSFSGPVRSENGFQTISVAAGTGAVTVTSTLGAATAVTSLSVSGGTVILTSLPTADPHVVGQLWSNAGVLTVSAG